MKNLKPYLTFLIIFLFASVENVKSQSWEKTFEQPGTLAKGFDVVEASDGGYVMCGEVDLPTGAPRHHIWAVKTDAGGNEMWSNIYHYGGIGMDEAKGLVETADGGFMIAGRSIDNQVQVFKISAAGDSLWRKSIPVGGSPVGEAIIAKPDGSGYFIVGGRETDPSIDVTSFMLFSLDNEGELLWEKTYDDTDGIGSKAMDIKPTSNGDFLIVGTVQSAQAGLIKIDSNGEQLWAKTYGLTNADYGLSVEETTNGEILLGGYTTGFAGHSPFLLHLDTNGNEINQPLIDVVNLGAISDIEKTSDGGYILTGSGFSFWGNIDSDPGFILKLNANLEPQWDSILANNQSQGTAVLGTSDGGLVMSGYNTSGMFLKKVAGITSNNENVLLENEVEINVYPNPSTDKLIFELPLEILTLGLSLELYDSAGQLLRSKRIDETKEILSFEGLATGSYSYVIREGNKPVQTGVVVRM